MVEELGNLTAAVLAGGLGTRLRPAVGDRPKVLAAVRGRPWLTYLLDQLAEAGVRDVVLLTGFEAEIVRSTLGDRYNDLRLRYSSEPEPLGTGGAVRRALPGLSSETVLLLNGDSCVSVDLAAFLDFHHQHGAKMSLVLTSVPDAARYGKVEVTPDGLITRFEEKRATGGAGWINAGVYLFHRALIAEVPPDRFVSLERDLLPGWVERRLCGGFRCPGPFLDIGTPEAYHRARRTGTRLPGGPLPVRSLAPSSSSP